MTSVPYLAHGATLSLAWFALVNVAVSALIALFAGRLLRMGNSRWPQLWLFIRLLPVLVSTFFVVALFVPSYWRYEPREMVEGFDPVSTLCAIVAIAIVALGAARGLAALRSADRRVRLWMQDARPITIAGVALPAYEVDAEQPIIALSGLFRPRLLVTRGFLGVLSESELSATIAHELGHRHAFDNLKRLAIRAAPDLLCGSATARAIERRWISAAEHAADRMAGSTEARCALASALVKVARLTPVGLPAAEPISTLIGGGEIASRVHELLDEAPPRRRPGAALTWIGGLAVMAGAAAVYTPLLRAVHEATEVLVRLLA